MTTATVPLPAGANRLFEAPRPEVLCAECGGLQPDLDFEASCGRCGGVGFEPTPFLLPKTRSYAWRQVAYMPTCGFGVAAGVLEIEVAKRSTHVSADRETYQLLEDRGTNWNGRSFLLKKAGVRHPDEQRDRREVFVGQREVRCTCEGFDYLSAAKANQRAYEAGEETCPTFGCKHADAVVALMLGGWFDL